MSEQDKKDPEEKSEGNSDNAAPDKEDESGNAGDHKEEDKKEEEKSETDLEEETYKERFSKSQKEVQEKLLPQLKAARKKLGLGENDFIAEDEEEKDDENDKNKDKKEDEKEEEQEDSEKEEEKEIEKETEKEVPLGSTPLRSNDPVTQTLYDEIWSSVADDDREDMNTDPKIRENMVKHFPMFLKDSEGNTRPYRQALIDTYEYVNRDKVRQKEFEKGRAKGLLEGKNTSDGTLNNTTGRQPSGGKKLTLSDDERKVAKNMGMTDEEYLEQKQKINE